MELLTIKIKHNKALRLIHDLEDLDLIEVVDSNSKKTQPKLSDLLKGSISVEQADDMQKELQEMRSEWERNTY